MQCSFYPCSLTHSNHLSANCIPYLHLSTFAALIGGIGHIHSKCRLKLLIQTVLLIYNYFFLPHTESHMIFQLLAEGNKFILISLLIICNQCVGAILSFDTQKLLFLFPFLYPTPKLFVIPSVYCLFILSLLPLFWEVSPLVHSLNVAPLPRLSYQLDITT
jgi:hypothetical protein